MDIDPCECVYNHESAMRRLLSLLRNSQDSCNDGTCNQDGPEGLSISGDGMFGAGNAMLGIMMAWMALAVTMYFLRPSSMRRRTDTKPSSSGAGGDDGGEPDDNGDGPGPSNRDPDPPSAST